VPAWLWAGLLTALPSCSSHRTGPTPPPDALATSAELQPSGEATTPSTVTAPAASASSTPSATGTVAGITGRKGPKGMIFDTDSPYGRVMVVDRKDERCLMFSDGGEQTCMDVKNPDTVVHEYVRFMAVGLLFVRQAPRTAMVGLGGGALIRLLLPHDPGSRMDVLELNPTVVQVAKDYFHVEPSDRLAMHVGDGREYLKTSKDRWDLMWLDAYGEDYIPFPLTTIEFVKLVADHLEPDGAVVANIWYRNDKLFRSMLHTYHEVFPSMYVFKGIDSVNGIVVGMRGKTPPTCDKVKERAKSAAKTYGFSFDLEVPAKQCTTIDKYKLDDVPVLDDSKEAVFKSLGDL
jgi:spermidine synthase